MMGERMTAAELRSIDADEYLVVELEDSEYWEVGEGRVTAVTEYDSGNVHVVIGHDSRLKIPSDARKGLRFNGAARGAKNLDVSGVFKR